MGYLELVEPFHAPASRDLLGTLFDQYRAMRQRIESVAGIVSGEMGAAVAYFLTGNNGALNGSRYAPAVDELFKPEGAVAALNADFWRRTLALTDVYECMPQARRDEWDKQIREMTVPDFTEDAVIPTVETFLASREQFLAERVDGIFRALSGNHVTNQPEGFGKRMILEYVFSDWGGVQWSRSGTINDLRCVIARFMGRDDPRTSQTSSDLTRMRKVTGEWHTLDGGALRVRVYMKGTAHLEVHPDMAWRLNAILHQLHPRAIPASARMKPAKPPKAFAMMQRPLPFEVVAILGDCLGRSGNTATISGYNADQNKSAAKEACRVLESIGGVRTDCSYAPQYEFGYDVREVLDAIVLSGCIPDKVSHQYYPTPERIAREAVEMARVQVGHECLEPSAGQGAIAALLPSPVCVEASSLHCRILRAKGLEVHEADFLQWAKSAPQFDRIVMNPPYSEGRWRMHVEAGCGLLAEGGRLVAIVPASARGKELMPGYSHEWSQVFAGEFADTSMDVAIVAMERAA